MSHKTDDLGLPLDPEMRRLQLYLGDLVGKWVEAYSSQEEQDAVVQENHATLAYLYKIGWDGVLDYDSVLTNNLMPEEYLKRHPYMFQPFRFRSFSDKKNPNNESRA